DERTLRREEVAVDHDERTTVRGPGDWPIAVHARRVLRELLNAGPTRVDAVQLDTAVRTHAHEGNPTVLTGEGVGCRRTRRNDGEREQEAHGDAVAVHI